MKPAALIAANASAMPKPRSPFGARAVPFTSRRAEALLAALHVDRLTESLRK